MHRQMRAAFFQRVLELLDEQPLAAHLRQGAVEDLVALRRHAEQLDAHAEARHEQVAHMLGLPQGQAALARGDDDGFGHAAILAARPAATAVARAVTFARDLTKIT